ncbi:thiamine diphosphokinase [Consotaella salsifontis]|uniref:Thiamine diphosphokinase n=1 Tax=Consotaella salsifontis TaxID=1365950 RepID=A0A1T4QT13_9HYPH|nr:thiamine diphosphokinase [Consotaella salsifontis]SKA06631.1 thiamine diphosphokinase [Consotaella salsifontis]
MSHFAILLAGPVWPTGALRAELSGARVIAADAGIAHAEALGLAPELWVGDFDSADVKASARFGGIERLPYPRDKAFSDGELAVEAAVARGAKSLTLVGGLGGPRSDHAFMNYLLALRYGARGISVRLASGLEEAWPMTDTARRFDLTAGTTFSILPFSDLSGLTVAGAKWPLDKVELPFHSVLTLSNEALGMIEVTIQRGRMILLAQCAAAGKAPGR